MKILAIDTATANCSAALLLDTRLLSRVQRLERGHAEHILPMVDELLREGAVTLPELDAIAFGRGPGAFTGLRLAASVAQGLAFGAGLPVVPVSDLAALAQQVFAADAHALRVLVCTDARMQEVYWGCFERDAQRLVVPVGEEHVGKPESVRLPDAWLRQQAAPAYGAGSGFSAYPQLRTCFAGAPGPLRGELLPRAQEIAQLAGWDTAQGRALPAEQGVPVYIRDEVAQARKQSSN